MPAPKGHAKWGGRKKGTPNKARQDLWAICQKHKCDPFEGMVILAMAEVDPDKQFDKLERIAQYVIPKCKAIEISENPDAPIGGALADKHLAKVKELHLLASKERKRG
jgi:hypothetical protein